MKLDLIISRLDDALFQLMEQQAMLESVETPNGAQTVAAGLQAPLDKILDILEQLMEKADRKKGGHQIRTGA